MTIGEGHCQHVWWRGARAGGWGGSSGGVAGGEAWEGGCDNEHVTMVHDDNQMMFLLVAMAEVMFNIVVIARGHCLRCCCRFWLTTMHKRQKK